jgi:diacylglycerol kinase family enzyme
MSALGLESMTIRSERPIAFQVDGDYLGETEAVELRFVPHALRVLA